MLIVVEILLKSGNLVDVLVDVSGFNIGPKRRRYDSYDTVSTGHPGAVEWVRLHGQEG